jgi:hypothetical protein
MNQKYGHCPVPNCERRIIPGRSAHGLCPHHEELLDFLLFVLPHIKINPGRTASGLVLPGTPEFAVPGEVTKLRQIEKHGGLKP